MFKSLTIATLTLSIALPAFAVKKDKIEKRGQNAGAILNRMLDTEGPDAQIPAALMSKAKCVAVFPRMFRAALGPLTLGLGGQRGKGLVSCKNDNGDWSAPSYVNMNAASIGLQFGIQRMDLVLVYVGDEVSDEFTGRNFSGNADISATLGPVGRSASAGTDFNNGVYSYAFSRGLFAGLSLGGLTISPDKKSIRTVYGKNATAADVLEMSAGDAPAAAQPFLKALLDGQDEDNSAAPANDEEEVEYDDVF